MEDEIKKSASRIKKEESVEALAEKLSRSQAVLLADYRGLNVAKSTELKKKLKENQAEMLIAKNTLLSLAAKKAGYDVPETELTGPTAAIFAYGDQITPLKDVAASIKAYELPKIKIGFLDKQLFAAEKLLELARLPSREVLLSQVVSSLNSPLYGLASVLNANLRNLVYALAQIKSTKSQNA